MLVTRDGSNSKSSTSNATESLLAFCRLALAVVVIIVTIAGHISINAYKLCNEYRTLNPKPSTREATFSATSSKAFTGVFWLENFVQLQCALPASVRGSGLTRAGI